MTRVTVLAVIGLSLSSSGVMADDAYYGERERGWFWYERPPEVVEKDSQEEEPPAATAPAAAVAPLTPREVLKQQGEEWEDAMALAVLEPTPENIRSYLEKTTQIQEQAQHFSAEFKRTIWTTPQFDYSLVRPTNPEAIMAGNQKKEQDNALRLRAIAGEKGLIFYFRSDCPYCHKFAPLLKRFAEAYGFTVIPVSLDGQGLPEYPYPKENGTLGHRLQVSQVPALYMVDPDRNTVAPVGFGYRDWSTLMSQILVADDRMNSTTELAGASR